MLWCSTKFLKKFMLWIWNSAQTPVGQQKTLIQQLLAVFIAKKYLQFAVVVFHSCSIPMNPYSRSQHKPARPQILVSPLPLHSVTGSMQMVGACTLGASLLHKALAGSWDSTGFKHPLASSETIWFVLCYPNIWICIAFLKYFAGYWLLWTKVF